jgi:hypothetical protein
MVANEHCLSRTLFVAAAKLKALVPLESMPWSVIEGSAV